MRVEHIGRATLTAIYALEEHPSGAVRYVGKTVRYLHERHKQHIIESRRRRLPVNNWIRGQVQRGETLAIRLLEYVPPGADWADRERHWIKHYREAGARLLNMTDGGEGLAGHRHSKEHREKIAAAIRTGATFHCLACGATFYRKRSAIEKGQAKFCSRPCANTYNRGGHRHG